MEKDATSIHPSTLSHPAASFAEARIASVKSPEALGAKMKNAASATRMNPNAAP